MRENFDIIMSQFLERVRHKPFQWGVWDCCIFTADAVKEITGIDYMAEFRGKYSNKEQAIKILGTTLKETLIKKFGPHKKVGSRGDVAFKFEKDGPAIGICFGEGSIFVCENGLEIIHSSECRFFGVPKDV